MNREGRWIFAAIVALALALRLYALDVKPPHFDEGVNGWFVDQITRQGFYHYDPSNFHGPLHFYLLFIAETLLGRHVWALRLPVALFSTGCVAFAFAFQRYFGERVCQLAALSMAVSPGMVFYGRDAIHESELLFFTMLTVWGGAAILQLGRSESTAASKFPADGWDDTVAPRVYFIWAFAFGITGMILTKETYAIHLVALSLAFPSLWLLERFSLSAPSSFRFPRGELSWRDFEIPIAACGGVILFFYSGTFLDWSSAPGLWQAFTYWFATGTQGKSGHEKEWHYWLSLLVRYEWPALFGLTACAWLLWPNRDRFIRYLGIAGTGTLVGYSMISYKTPWCIISLTWPLFFVFACGIVRAARTLDRWVARALCAFLLAGSLASTLSLNFKNATDENEPYVYVQTNAEVGKLLDPLRWLTCIDPIYYHIRGHILLPIEESHPLPWLLGDFTQIDFLDQEHPPSDMDADFLLVDDALVPDTEERMHDSYFKESFLLRGNSGQFVTLYLKAATFGLYFPNRSPEFHPPDSPAAERATQP